MAKRPIFVPNENSGGLAKQVDFNLTWHSGFAPVQKKKNIKELHSAAAKAGYFPLLEVSTKSDDSLGQRLSAFNLKVETDDYGLIPMECAYQGSKIFEGGGPYSDLYFSDARAAKRDFRLENSGRLVAFEFIGVRFPLEPKTAFYDWLYITSLVPKREEFFNRLEKYVGFTDIEFNPQKSVNCQARSCAMFVSLMKASLLQSAVQSPEAFISFLNRSDETENRSIDADNLRTA